mgnify:CR=1 FL=1
MQRKYLFLHSKTHPFCPCNIHYTEFFALCQQKTAGYSCIRRFVHIHSGFQLSMEELDEAMPWRIGRHSTLPTSAATEIGT